MTTSKDEVVEALEANMSSAAALSPTRRQPREEVVRLTSETLRRKVASSPLLTRALREYTAGRLSAPTIPNSVPYLGPSSLFVRCEICRSLSPEALEVEGDPSRLTRPPGVLHHDFAGLQTSAETGCNICQLLSWGIHHQAFKLSKLGSRGLHQIRSSNPRFYLRLSKGRSPLKPKLVLSYSGFGPADERWKDPKTKKWLVASQILASEERVASPLALPNENANSKEVFNLVENWLRTCREDHPTCKAISRAVTTEAMPKRLIDVGEAGSIYNPRVISVEKPVLVYAALSYAWGPSGHRMILTNANLESMSREIDLSSMPQTFRDAITVCQKLHVRYLWIDALCIVQSGSDSDAPREELSQQIAIMGQIYANAAFTIAAASGASVHEGLFGADKRFPRSLESHQIYSRNSENPWYATPYEPDWRTVVTNGPLQQRAWVLQERILSRRVLHFTQWAIFWECTSLKASEFRPSGLLNMVPEFATPFSGCYVGLPVIQPSTLSPEQKNELLTMVWGQCVGWYTARHLTAETDMFPAISAIARKFGDMTDDVYLAGMWSSVLWQNLLWKTKLFDLTPTQRPGRYLAPSWSWASVIGGSISPGRNGPKVQALIILSASTTPLDPANPYGEITSGILRVRGLLRRECVADRRRTNALVEHYIKTSRDQGTLDVSAETAAVLGTVRVRSTVESRVHFDVRVDEGLTFSVLQVSGPEKPQPMPDRRDEHVYFCGLAIVPTGDEGQYRRIGFVEICDKGFFDKGDAVMETLDLF